MSKLLLYNHPAVSPQYKAGKYYSLTELQDDGLGLDEIKLLFKPANFEWEKEKKIKFEDLI